MDPTILCIEWDYCDQFCDRSNSEKLIITSQFRLPRLFHIRFVFFNCLRVILLDGYVRRDVPF